MRDRWLQNVKAVILRQQCMTPESHELRFRTGAQNSGAGFRWAGLTIFNRLPFAPFGNRFDIGAEFSAQRRVRSLPLSGH